VAEAWLFIATGLLGAVGVRLGGLLDQDVEAIRAARRGWLRGHYSDGGVLPQT
jgi:hypothetical protein